MSNRYADWFRQAEPNLRHTRNSLENGDFESSCFAAHQAAEKALNAVFPKLGMDSITAEFARRSIIIEGK